MATPLAWHYENTLTSKLTPEVVSDFLTDYTALDHDSPPFREENGGQPMRREVTQLGDGKVRLQDTGKRFTNDLTVHLRDRPNQVPRQGMTHFGPWMGWTAITRTADGGTNWHSTIDILPNRLGAKLVFALFDGKLRESVAQHERQPFVEMEQALGAR